MDFYKGKADMLDFKKFNSVIAVINYFNSEKACKDALIEARWGNNEDAQCCGNRMVKR